MKKVTIVFGVAGLIVGVTGAVALVFQVLTGAPISEISQTASNTFLFGGVGLMLFNQAEKM